VLETHLEEEYSLIQRSFLKRDIKKM